MRAIAIMVLALGFLCAGCGREGDRSTVGQVTGAFFAALRSGDGAGACDRLSPETRAQLEKEEKSACRDAVTKVQLAPGSVGSVEVDVVNAVVELSSGETAFLEKGSEGWRLSAVGCKPLGGQRAGGPYDCEIED